MQPQRDMEQPSLGHRIGIRDQCRHAACGRNRCALGRPGSLRAADPQQNQQNPNDAPHLSPAETRGVFYPNALHCRGKALQGEGFRLENGTLKDKDGNPVVFSIITNAGNKSRERMATMIQEDLQKIGVQVNVVTLDFPSLIERMTQTFDYEAILLGLTNVGLDPSEQMNVWLSSSENHQWNPSEKAPETAWEAEIDRLMRAQASSADAKKRKESFDRVQEIAVEQAPFLYLVNRNALSAVSGSVQGASPVILAPQTYWNVERLSLK